MGEEKAPSDHHQDPQDSLHISQNLVHHGGDPGPRLSIKPQRTDPSCGSHPHKLRAKHKPYVTSFTYTGMVHIKGIAMKGVKPPPPPESQIMIGAPVNDAFKSVRLIITPTSRRGKRTLNLRHRRRREEGSGEGEKFLKKVAPPSHLPGTAMGAMPAKKPQPLKGRWRLGGEANPAAESCGRGSYASASRHCNDLPPKQAPAHHRRKTDYAPHRLQSLHPSWGRPF